MYMMPGIPRFRLPDFSVRISPVLPYSRGMPCMIARGIKVTRKFNIEMPDVVIKVNPDRTDLVETRVIDGKQCLVIEVTDRIEVNGVSVIAGKMED